MHTASRFRLALLCAGLPLAVLPTLRAQNLALTQFEGQTLPVESVIGGKPFVKIDGKLAVVTSGAVSLRRTPFYRTGFVVVSDYEAHGVYQEFAGGGTGGASSKATYYLKGNLTANLDLKNCYLVYETLGTKAQSQVFGPVALPDLPSGIKTHFAISLVVPRELGRLKYVLHVFSGHGEYLNSRSLNDSGSRTEAAYLAAEADREPLRLLKVPPVYPKGLGEPSVSDTANVRCRIGLDGEVHDAALIDASQPELGPPALAAARQWIFVPAVAHHQFVEATLELPVSFPAP